MRRPRPRHLARLALSARARQRWRRERFLGAATRHGVWSLGITDANGRRYSIDPRDGVIGRLLFLQGAFDAEPVDAAVRALGAEGFVPDQIIDVGANIGTVTVELLRRYPAATAAAFEPDPDNCRLLRQNLVANELLDRTTVFQVALSDTDGIVALQRSPDNFGDHKVRSGGGAGTGVTLTVQAVRLEGLLATGALALGERVLTKLDVQGHEGHVLTAARPLLEHPLVVEFWPHGLRRAGGFETFLQAIEAYSAVEVLGPERRTVGVDDLRAMSAGLGLGHVDLLAVP